MESQSSKCLPERQELHWKKKKLMKLVEKFLLEIIEKLDRNMFLKLGVL